MTHTRGVLVIGAGIAGTAAAMALQKAGIDSVVYEAHPSGTEDAGTFLTLGSNGIDALASRPRASRRAARPACASASWRCPAGPPATP
jgi:2-polyprenyl-6-methoxyphenol hydroxylase-like FAD-dependent oxidoreductase